MDDRRAYELLKRDLATREWADMNEYAYAKRELIGTILAKAGITSDSAASPQRSRTTPH